MFARHQFELAKPTSDGASVREHLELVAERTGELPELLANAPECPSSAVQLWADFLEMHTSRSSNGFAVSRITWRDMADWQSVRGVKLSPWEVDQIVRLDNMWLNEFAPKAKPEEEVPSD
jgi:hypothetical protein